MSTILKVLTAFLFLRWQNNAQQLMKGNREISHPLGAVGFQPTLRYKDFFSEETLARTRNLRVFAQRDFAVASRREVRF